MVKMSACRAVTEWVRLPYRPQIFASLAQLAERYSCKVNVVGSIPTRGSINIFFKNTTFMSYPYIYRYK